MKPTVSVMMVCYNGAKTLPWALGSLLAQTCADWECVFVDDGSTDGSSDLVLALQDPRIRTFRFDENRGRGAARQLALERARGDYLCILDSDDWMYPWRIEAEATFLAAEPSAALVSSGMAIVNRGDLAGVRGHRAQEPHTCPPLGRLRMPPLSFPACMVRMSAAKLCKFDPGFPTVEDIDFLLQLVMKHGYGILHQNLYAYTEYETVTLPKSIAAFHCCQRLFRAYRRAFPVQSITNAGIVFAKSGVYRAAFAIGQDDWLIRRRSRTATPKEAEEFELAKRTVASNVQLISGTHTVDPKGYQKP